MALRRPKKGGGTNFFGTETGQNFCSVVTEERRYTDVFGVTKYRRAEILPVSARRGSTPVSLYTLGDGCGGNFRILSNDIKDCSECTLPHSEQGYAYITDRFEKIRQAEKKSRSGDPT